MVAPSRLDGLAWVGKTFPCSGARVPAGVGVGSHRDTSRDVGCRGGMDSGGAQRHRRCGGVW